MTLKYITVRLFRNHLLKFIIAVNLLFNFFKTAKQKRMPIFLCHINTKKLKHINFKRLLNHFSQLKKFLANKLPCHLSFVSYPNFLQFSPSPFISAPTVYDVECLSTKKTQIELATHPLVVPTLICVE